MTALWFEHLRSADRVSVKPHASPVLHAINYLLGELDERYLSTLRAFGGLQSYSSRAKDPDLVDYSTGSVGIGATAPIWGALARRYVAARHPEVGTGRQYSLVGDAELDEGAVWEAILDPMVGELGEVVWIVDLNRQSLDRVVPDIGATRLQGMFGAAGWQVLTVKYGRILEELFTCPGGAALRRRIDEMPNPEYQRLLRCTPAQLRERLPGDSAELARGAGRGRPPRHARPSGRRGLCHQRRVAVRRRPGPGRAGGAPTWILDAAFPAHRAAPMVTLLDGHPHTLAFLAGVNQVRAVHLGVSRFGQSGDLDDVYREHGLDAGSVVAAVLDAVR